MDTSITKRPPIAMTPCESSYLREYGFCPETKTLRVTFNSGKGGDYAGVDLGTYNELAQAESKGQFFYRRIRDEYAFTPFEDEAAANEPDSMGG